MIFLTLPFPFHRLGELRVETGDIHGLGEHAKGPRANSLNEPAIVPDQPRTAGPKATAGLQATAGSPPPPSRLAPGSRGCSHRRPNPIPVHVPTDPPTAPARGRPCHAKQ